MAGRRAVNKQSLPEMIAEDLRGRILSGELAEGEPIRQELLAEDYEVSRMPVREALKRLSAEGLVHWENNRGGTVVKHSLPEIAEIFDLRALIEGDLFRRAIPAMSADDFEACAEILQKMEESYAADDVAAWGRLNQDYHMALYKAGQRPMSMEMLERISLHSDRYVRIHLSVMKQREQARAEHRRLLELARAGDVEGGVALLAQHIGRTKAELLQMIEAKRRAAED